MSNSPDATRAEPAAVWAPLDALRPWSRNPRRNDGRPVEAVERSMRELGAGAPIVARRSDGRIIAGHTRWKAAMRLTHAEDRSGWHPDAVRIASDGIFPVRYVELDDDAAKKLALADNRLNELAAWDTRELESLVDGMSVDEHALMGWEPEELAALLEGIEAAEVDADEAFEGIPSGEKDPFQQMAFMLHTTQLPAVMAAIDLAKSKGQFGGPNSNANANALHRICEEYVR